MGCDTDTDSAESENTAMGLVTGSWFAEPM
jgi:hypothetical protein